MKEPWLKHFRLFFRLSEKVLGIGSALSPNREWAKNKNIKNSLEATWNASHLA